MTFKLYDILGLPRNCNNDDIKKSYKKMAIVHHPDKGGDVDKFKEISNAYSILSDPEKKNRYDQLGDEGYNNSGVEQQFDHNSIFEQFFGQAQNGFFGMDGFNIHQHQQRRKCRNVQHVIKISNKEAYFGGQKILKISINKKCMECISMCVSCQGQGQINELHRIGPFASMSSRTCDNCKGSGKCVKGKKSCVNCKGIGDYVEEKKLDLHIPIGVESGKQIIFAGMGEQPHNQNEIAGDLIFDIFVSLDNVFERRGLDLIYKCEISFYESVTGKSIDIPLYDNVHTIEIEKFGIIQPNKEYKIPQKGMISENKKGNLILLFEIRYPKLELSEDCKNDFKTLFEKHSIIR